MAKRAIITGATSGICNAVALRMAALGFDVIITGRREERLKLLQAQIIEKYKVGVLSLCFDVRDSSAVEKAFNTLTDDWKQVDVLINNAGLAVGLDPIQNGVLDDWERMIDTNVKGFLYVSRSVLPMMVARNAGHVLNIGSIAAKEVYSNGNVYCASKHAVDALSKAMRIDLLKHHIRVTAIHPGNTETEFSMVRFKGDTERAKKVYEGYEQLNADDIADAIVYAITRPLHVNINDMVIMSTAQANTSHLLRE